jgi:hypothetical protein
MSDGGRERASLVVKVWKSSQEWSVQRSAVRSIAWLGVSGSGEFACEFIGEVRADSRILNQNKWGVDK